MMQAGGYTSTFVFCLLHQDYSYITLTPSVVQYNYAFFVHRKPANYALFVDSPNGFMPQILSSHSQQVSYPPLAGVFLFTSISKLLHNYVTYLRYTTTYSLLKYSSIPIPAFAFTLL
jgi:hypothetical protein